jgi:hypothetical protein
MANTPLTGPKPAAPEPQYLIDAFADSGNNYNDAGADKLFTGFSDLGTLRMNTLQCIMFHGQAAGMRLAEFVRNYKNIDGTKGAILLTGINIVPDSQDVFHLFYMGNNESDVDNIALKSRLTGGPKGFGG